jgi:hypothetical protein
VIPLAVLVWTTIPMELVALANAAPSPTACPCRG